MNKLINKILKRKHLQKMGGNLVVIIPKSWISALEWNQEDEIFIALHADDQKIVISKNKNVVIDNEEISDIIPIGD